MKAIHITTIGIAVLIAVVAACAAPQDDTTADGTFPEAWNIGINLVWYVCPQGAMHAGHSRYRPLFNVADNGTLIVNTVR